MIAICTVMESEDGKKWVSLEDYQKLLEKYEGEVGYETNEQIIERAGEDEIPEDNHYNGCTGCAHERESETGQHCIRCTRNGARDLYKRATNFDACCWSVETMARVIKVQSRDNLTTDELEDWLRKET